MKRRAEGQAPWKVRTALTGVAEGQAPWKVRPALTGVADFAPILVAMLLSAFGAISISRRVTDGGARRRYLHSFTSMTSPVVRSILITKSPPRILSGR